MSELEELRQALAKAQDVIVENVDLIQSLSVENGQLKASNRRYSTFATKRGQKISNLQKTIQHLECTMATYDKDGRKT